MPRGVIIILPLLLLVIISEAMAQMTIRGKLLSEKDQQPIPYANIGIVETSVGTISNEDGTFEVVVPKRLMTDTLVFSALGYGRQLIPVSSFKNRHAATILLAEETTILRSVTVKGKKLKPMRTFQLGNSQFNSGSFYTDSLTAGSAMALLIENKYPSNPELTVPFFVRKAKLRISYNTFDRFKVRLRFLSVDSVTGAPGTDLFNENIIATSKLRKGWLTFDLTDYNVRIDVPAFYLTFEWIIEDDDRKLLMEMYREFARQFPKQVKTDTIVVEGQKITFHTYQGYRAGTSFGSSSDQLVVNSFRCYYRSNSYGQWKRSSTVLAANVIIVNY